MIFQGIGQKTPEASSSNKTGTIMLRQVSKTHVLLSEFERKKRLSQGGRYKRARELKSPLWGKER
jgi:hypothetical protein